jgi:hypothetical protein
MAANAVKLVDCMSKRKLAWLVVAVVAAVALAGLLWSLLGTSRLAFTEPDIQARLNKELPKTVKDVTVERVTVHLADRRLALTVDLHGALLRQPLMAALSARGVPRYEAQSGELYFDVDDVKIDQLTIAGRSIGGDDAAGGPRAQAAGATVRRIAETAMQVYFAAQPVYRFKEDFKGFVLRAALKDVTIEQNAVMVTFSIWNVTATVAVLAVVLIGVLSAAVYLLMRHPPRGRRSAGSPPPTRSVVGRG